MQGFSLFELLITLTIIAIISLFAFPSQTFLYDKANAKILSEQLQRAIHLTRSEAMMRGSSVILCNSNDQITCKGKWQEGYIIIEDHKVLFAFQNHAKGNLYWRAFPKSQTYLEFLPSGFPNAENGTFWYCPQPKQNPVWALALNQAGRVKLVNPDASGQVLDDKGIPLTC